MPRPGVSPEDVIPTGSENGPRKACMADQIKARDDLVRQWAQFAPDSRARCTQMVTGIAGMESYVELLTCLQMAKDVKNLPKQ